VEETDFEIGHFRNFRIYMTLTLDWVIRHTVVYHSTYKPNLVQIWKTFCGRADRRIYCGYMDSETGFIRLTHTSQSSNNRYSTNQLASNSIIQHANSCT